jgi:hypothetical protein
MTTDTETIEHLREITIRQAERIERLEGELIRERAHSRRLTDELMHAGKSYTEQMADHIKEHGSLPPLN